MIVGTIIFGLILCAMLGTFLLGAILNGIDMLRRSSGWRLWLALSSCFLVAIGAVAFFGQGLSAVGALNWLPPTLEWPAGRVDDALTTADGRHLVLLRGAGRIQVYDPSWHFVRGWPAESARKLRLLPDGTVEALTRGLHGKVFDLNGNLVARRTYQVQEMVKLENSLTPHPCVSVATPAWLYILSSPLLSGSAMFAGMLGWFAIAHKSSRTV